MPSIDDTAYPQLKQSPTEKDLLTLYTPTAEELDLARRVTLTLSTRLCFLVLLKTFQKLGYGVKLATVSARIIRHVVASAQLPATQNDLRQYDASTTRRRHLAIIREYLQIQAFEPDGHQAMNAAIKMAVFTKYDLVDLINIAIEELVRQRFELPGFTTVLYAARSIRKQTTEALYQQVEDRLSPKERIRLDELFSETDQDDATAWERLKQEPGKPLLSRLRVWIDHLKWLSTLQLAHTVLADIPLVKIQHFAAEALSLDNSRMNALSASKRHTLLASVLKLQYAQALDDLTEMFVKRMRHLHHSGKEALAQHRIDTQRDTDELVQILRDVLIAYQSDGEVPQRFEAMQQVIGDDPDALLQQCETHLNHEGNNYFSLLPRFYRSHRATLFRLVGALTLKPSGHDTTLADAVQFIQTHQHKRSQWLPITETVALDNDETSITKLVEIKWVSSKWWSLVTGQDKRLPAPQHVHRVYFELCVFSYLLLEVQSGDMYVEGSNEYSDYYAQLISWEEYNATVSEFGQMVGLAIQPSEFVAHLKQWLATHATQTDESFPANSQLTYDKDRFIVHRYSRKRPSDLTQLETLLHQRLPPVHLLDVLSDTQAWLNWTRFFKPISGYESKLEQPVARYLLTTFCYGCNVGPSQTARSLESLDRRQFSWVNRRHISEAGLQEAITHIINAYNHFALPKFWGTGNSASVDGTKWDMYEQNLLAEYHIRYGGYGGIGYYHVSDTYIALFSHFIPCGVWEAVYILDGLLNNESDIQPDTIHGDTQAQSATVFGLAHLLGITLMPRIRNWQDLAFLRPTKSAKYKHINTLFSSVANWALIEEHLPNMLRVAMSVKAGKIKASTILRKLGTNSYKNKLFQAFHELGTILRTGFLLQYLNDEELRQTIQAATNKSESFNRFAKWLAFGGEKVIMTNNRDEQRKFIKYNHLVANCLIFYNVFQLSRILNQLIQEGYSFSTDAIAALSPYRTEHINRLGRYQLDLERKPPKLHFDLSIVDPVPPHKPDLPDKGQDVTMDGLSKPQD
ncbi:MAG: Tn3 family transposase [Leptolyngbyaceae cyanobacterium]